MANKTIVNKKLKTEISVPDPLLGTHWSAYERAYNGDQKNAESPVTRLYLAALKVLESGTCDGVEDLRTAGLAVPVEVLSWVGQEVDRLFADAFGRGREDVGR